MEITKEVTEFVTIKCSDTHANACDLRCDHYNYEIFSDQPICTYCKEILLSTYCSCETARASKCIDRFGLSGQGLKCRRDDRDER